MRYEEPALDSLRRYMNCVRPVKVPGLPRFFGGAVGYCSYETVHHLEKLPNTKPDLLKWPIAKFFITGDLFVFDNTQQILKIISCARIKNKQDVEKAYAKAKTQVLNNLKMLKGVHPRELEKSKGPSDNAYMTNMDKNAFM